jgi:hypothetical protein
MTVIVAAEVLFLVQLCLLVYCVLNVVTTPEGECRNLPKLVWLVLVVLLPIAGGIAWLVAGRPVGRRRPATPAGDRGVPPEYDRPGRAAAQNPDDDAEFLAQLKARAEQQRKNNAAEQARRLREQEDEAPPS